MLAVFIDCKQQPAAAVVACTAGENKPLHPYNDEPPVPKPSRNTTVTVTASEGGGSPELRHDGTEAAAEEAEVEYREQKLGNERSLKNVQPM